MGSVPRRILMTADGVGGVWPYATDLSAALVERGAQVTLAVMGPPLGDDQIAEASECGMAIVEGGYRLEWMAEPWDDVEAAGAWLLSLDAEIRPDIVHLNGFCHGALPWRAPAIVVGHSCVRSWWQAVHGDDAPPEWDEYARNVTRGLRSAALVVAPSATMLEWLDGLYGPLAGVVVPNGSACVDQVAAAAPQKCELVFSAGRLWDEAKNVESLCAIAPDLSWPVFVAGDPRGRGSDGERDDGAQYLGRLARASLRGWFERAAIYALPARYEPFGLSILEAASAGCALVLGDIRTLRENWSGAASFVPPDNRRALARAIQELIDQPERRMVLAAAAIVRARQFTVERMVNGYLDVYSRAPSGAPAYTGVHWS